MDTIDAFLASHPYAAQTKRTYSDVLHRLLAAVKPDSLTAAGLVHFLEVSGWGNKRQCMALAAIQKYLAWRFGPDHPARMARLQRIEGKPQRALTQQVALQLLASFNPYTPKGARDLALCALALDTGLRESELCRLEMRYVNTDTQTLEVVVKGGDWEAAIYSPDTAAHVEHWKSHRPACEHDYLFVSFRTGQAITPEGLNRIVGEWGKTIGIQLSPQDFRRSFAVIGTLNGAAERILMEGGRWKSSQMIKTYTRTLRLEAMKKYLPVPSL